MRLAPLRTRVCSCSCCRTRCARLRGAASYTQYIINVCKALKGHLAPNAQAISMIKGVEVKQDSIDIYADVIERQLGIPCAALSGANIANEGASCIGRWR